MNKINRAGGIIINSNLDSVLMILNRDSYKDGSNKWGFPKGHLDYGESFDHCAKREIREETGLILPIELFNNNFIKIHNTIYFIIYLKHQVDDFNPPDKSEVYEVKWMNFKNVHKYNMNRDIRKFINKNKSSENYDLCLVNNLIEEEVQIIINDRSIVVN